MNAPPPPANAPAAARRTWLDLLLVTLLGLPLVTPLLRWSSVPCTHDGHLHYHRVAAIRHAWEQGLYFSRWLPDLAFGYGYPFFVYREPLPLYLTHFLHLAGLPLPAATNLFYLLAILAAGWFMYLWVRDVFGARAGLVAAVAYMAAPYQLADALVRGNQVESMALALFPLLLWAGRRFVLAGRARWFLVATLALAALSLSHNISLLIFTPALGVYLLAVGWQQAVPWRTLLLRLALFFGLGLLLTSFYTGTALLEMDQVTLGLSTTTRNNDFRYNFATLAEIFAPVTPENPALLNPPLLFRLGWVPAGLALLGLLSFFRNRGREQRLHIALMAGAAVLYLFFALAIARPVWETLPLIEFVQFPWRFVGRAALPVALLAGAAFVPAAWSWLPWPARWPARPPWLGQLALVAALALLYLEAIPNLYPNDCPEAGYPTILTVHNYEHETGLVGVDPEGSYFPRTVAQRPTGSPLEADYLAGRPPQRFDLADLLAGSGQLLSADYGPNRATITVDSPAGFQATYLTFAFPGWVARVDGQPVPITPSVPDGLITFPVPAGAHTLAVRWQSTPLRTALGLLSLLALAGIVGTALWLARAGGTQEPAGRPGRGLPVGLLMTLALALLLGKLLLFDRLETPLRRAADLPVTYPAGLSAGLTGAEMRLAGYNLSRTSVPAGGTFDIDLAWQAVAPPGGAYQSNVWLAGPEGLTWSDKETYRPRVYEDVPPTLFWQPGQWGWDSREVQVLPGTPPGVYDIVLTYFPLDTLQPLTLVGAGGPTAVIGQIEVTRPGTPPEFTPQFPLTADVSGLTLLGYNQDRAEAAPGDPLLLTLFWQGPAAALPAVAELPLQLLDEAGGLAHTWQIPPVRADYPPAAWEPGERLRGQHLLRLPAGLASGTYQLALADVPLGTLNITAPARSFAPPAGIVPLALPFGDALALAGYQLDWAACAPGGDCPLTLVWQGLAEMDTSYHVFVHLVDETGRILAQADGQPAGWTRPTTGWAAGEYVSDTHLLVLPGTLPAGGLALRVGVYDPDTGQRLLTPAGEEYVTLPLP